MNRDTHYDWQARCPSYLDRVETVRNRVLHELEGRLLEWAQDDKDLLKFTLERRFPKRYGKKVEVDAKVATTSLDTDKLRGMKTGDLEQLERLARQAVADEEASA